MSILMLSGVSDEVVPKVHMKDLWEIVSKRWGEKQESKEGEQVGTTTFLEFENGTHSKWLFSRFVLWNIDLCVAFFGNNR
jgi:hypothetical protein